MAWFIDHLVRFLRFSERMFLPLRQRHTANTAFFLATYEIVQHGIHSRLVNKK